MGLVIEQMSNGPNFVPGDRADLFAVYDSLHTTTATKIAENVEILAIATGGGLNPIDRDTQRGANVTVAVDVKQAEVLAEAQEEASRLLLTLRGSGQ
jgi:Flp pilus assembly protein CpaB